MIPEKLLAFAILVVALYAMTPRSTIRDRSKPATLPPRLPEPKR